MRVTSRYPISWDFERWPMTHRVFADEATDDGILPRLRAAVPAERRGLLTAMLCAELIRVLGLGPEARIDPRKNLADLGVDSLRAVDAKIGLEKSLDCALPTTLLYDYPTVESLVNYLAE